MKKDDLRGEGGRWGNGGWGISSFDAIPLH